MTKLTLFIELLEVIKELLEASMTAYNVRHAHQLMELAFNRFEEREGMKLSDLDTIINDISIKLVNMPPELKEYFQLMEQFQVENEIYSHDITNFNNSIEVAQFAIAFFTILNDLLQAGVTPDNTYLAHLLLDDLFKEFEEQVEKIEDLAKIDDSETLCHCFPNIEIMLENITILQGGRLYASNF